MLHHRADGNPIETPPVGIAGVDPYQREDVRPARAEHAVTPPERRVREPAGVERRVADIVAEARELQHAKSGPDRQRFVELANQLIRTPEGRQAMLRECGREDRHGRERAYVTGAYVVAAR